MNIRSIISSIKGMFIELSSESKPIYYINSAETLPPPLTKEEEREVIDGETGEPVLDPDTQEPITETVIVSKTCLINYNNALIHEIEYYPQPKTLDIEGTGDVLLDVPSNAYYQCMLYYMAIWYKTRQNEDASAIQGLYEQAVANFTDTLKIDVNEYPQMRDVYTRIWR